MEISNGVDEENSMAWVTDVWCIACTTDANILDSVYKYMMCVCGVL